MCRTVALLLAYNHEKYVRLAALDVLAQDLDDLTVVFSDDCSSDATFDILLEIAGAYSGNKHLIVRRNHKNLGMNAHINRLVEDTEEEILIPFSGDDRFEPSRARILTNLLSKDTAVLAHSAMNFVDELGNAHSEVYSQASFYHSTDAESAATSEALYVGATSAWKRRLFEKYGALPDNKAYEDLILGFRASLEKGVVYTTEELVSYRVGVGRSFSDSKKIRLDQNGQLFSLQRSRDLMLARLADCNTYGLSADSSITLKISEVYHAKTEAILTKTEAILTKTEAILTKTDHLLTKIQSELDATKVELLQTVMLNEKLREELKGKGKEMSNLKIMLGAVANIAYSGFGGLLLLKLTAARILKGDLFDETWYLSKYRDVNDYTKKPIEHFLRHGMAEGRSPKKPS